MKVIDDFISEEYLNQIQSFLTSEKVPWFYQNNLTFCDDKSPQLASHGFQFNLVTPDNPNVFRDNEVVGEGVRLLKPLVLSIKDKVNCFAEPKVTNILKCRLDFTTYVNKNIRHAPHTDLDDPHITTIFYVMDSDGDTLFYNTPVTDPSANNKTYRGRVVERVSPKANRLIIFNGSIVHTGHSPRKHDIRILLNTNFN